MASKGPGDLTPPVFGPVTVTQARMKEEERQKKQAEFKEKTQAILDQQQAEIEARMREMEEAEKERRRVMEEQRLQQLREAEEKRKVRFLFMCATQFHYLQSLLYVDCV